MMIRLHRRLVGQAPAFEECYYIDVERTLTDREFERIAWLISSPLHELREGAFFEDDRVIEIGPLLAMETPFSSNAVAICRQIGIPVTRMEMSRRWLFDGERGGAEYQAIHKNYLDWVTQAVYETRPDDFVIRIERKHHNTIPVLMDGPQGGINALRLASQDMGIGADDEMLKYFLNHVRELGRDPTALELAQFVGNNSEHSRHPYWNSFQVIDGVEMPRSLMDVVKEPWKRNSGNSLVAFHDNAGVIRGRNVPLFVPANPGSPSPFVLEELLQHITATAETHNHPTFLHPFSGAETGIGGEKRDEEAQGRGASAVGTNVAGYCTGNLHIPEYPIPGEVIGGEVVNYHASPLDILIRGSDGVSDYGNKLGVPLVGGFMRSFGQLVEERRREFRKPVLYCGGTSRVLDAHFQKHSPEVGMLIVQIGGPAYRIGVGGAGHSSQIIEGQGKDVDLSVQRGNAEVENRVNRVIQACAALGERNPIESVHDQGAGGPSNVLTELIEPLGGKINLDKIVLGDKTMTALEVWIAEYQERYGLLVNRENLALLQCICKREQVNCEVLGEITGDGNITVTSRGSTVVDMSLDRMLGGLPRKRYELERLLRERSSLVLPKNLAVAEALERVLKLPAVGSKGYLVRKVDRSVTGLVTQQQCVGPFQVPVADVAVEADSYFSNTGSAKAIGENSNRLLIDPCAGARMAVAEMLTNLASARITRLPDVKCRANWMWPAKQPGEGAHIYDAAVAMSEMMIELGIAIDGGKDSLSMAAVIYGEGHDVRKRNDELILSPGQLVILGYAPVPDVRKVVTPNFKGFGHIGFIDFGCGKNRLGGSALAQALNQLGDDSPDIDDVGLLARAFRAVQSLVAKGLVQAYHDRSDGGLITTLAEMCIAGNCGAKVHIPTDTATLLAELFAEEAGMVFQVRDEYDVHRVENIMRRHSVSFTWIGTTDPEDKRLVVTSGEGAKRKLLACSVTELRQWWEATSTALELEQANRETVLAESRSHADGRETEYVCTFSPKSPRLRVRERPYKVGVVRECGTNGEREMAAAFHAAGFEVWDVAMSDLVDGRLENLDQFRGIGFPGGFSNADVLGSAKGWAGRIRFNERLEDMFRRFYERPDTFSLGVCNGCQLMANLGWLPYRGIPEASQPRFVPNLSGRFESRWSVVKVLSSPAIMLRRMEGSVLGIHVAHGEGRLLLPDPQIADDIQQQQLVPLVYVDVEGNATEEYPYNPNGSPLGWTALCSPDGRHLAMMPHPERGFRLWQWHWVPHEWRGLKAAPWLQMFQNAYDWCRKG